MQRTSMIKDCIDFNLPPLSSQTPCISPPPPPPTPPSTNTPQTLRIRSNPPPSLQKNSRPPIFCVAPFTDSLECRRFSWWLRVASARSSGCYSSGWFPNLRTLCNTPGTPSPTFFVPRSWTLGRGRPLFWSAPPPHAVGSQKLKGSEPSGGRCFWLLKTIQHARCPLAPLYQPM